MITFLNPKPQVGNRRSWVGKIFLTRQLAPIAKEMLEDHFEVSENKGEKLSENDLIQVVKDYDGVLCTLADVFNADLFKHASALKVISNYAIGLDNIDVAEAQARGIQVYNLPDIVTDSTADLTFAILLSLIRKIPAAREFVLKGQWQSYDPSIFWGEELAGKTFGIIGFGRTGKAVAKRAQAFGLEVIVYHRREIPYDDQEHYGVRQVSFDALLAQVDYLSLHVPLTDKTRFMIDKSAFKKMARAPVLINVSRGAVVHPEDLVDALKAGQVRGAALDVTFPEPISSHHALCQLENCLIVPHIGTATIDCRTLMAKKAAENLITAFSKAVV